MMFGVLLMPAVAYGAVKMLSRHRSLFLVAFMVLIIECMYFGVSYVFHFDSANSITRQDAVKPLIEHIARYKDRRVYVPQDSTMAIYYLFFNKILDPEFAGRFKTEARIPQIHNVRFLPEHICFTSLDEVKSVGLREGDIVALKYTCGERSKDDHTMSLITFVKQTGELLGYRIYEYRGRDDPK